ncbi:MAG: type 2 isopentenyl-diphosphate Delta-isomerase [Holosporaceae bacterium]|jgi:isopentenyl-diphosphate delta-isomerase|nr:type 2 isopentenyl-diphosphate Delta-isomerase [Holosporaceae bacterium]
MDETQQRKKDHLSLFANAGYGLSIDSGFSKYRFEHNALPEIDFAEIDTSVEFLNRKLKMPLIISSITEGSASERINRNLAGIASDFGLGMAVGNWRMAIEDRLPEGSFAVRSYAPNILLLANLGAIQLNYGYSVNECRRIVDMIDADALLLHLNPLQEIFQMKGNTNFSGLLKKIERVCSSLRCPVIVKEVGYGISAATAKKLQEVGVYGVDVAGMGSTSCSSLENRGSSDVVVKKAVETFLPWGNSTVDCIVSIAEMRRKIKIIASGGVRNGVDIAKSIALGANICGNASDFLHNILISRSDCENFVESLILELKTAMMCVGCRNIRGLRSAKLMKIE